MNVDDIDDIITPIRESWRIKNTFELENLNRGKIFSLCEEHWLLVKLLFPCCDDAAWVSVLITWTRMLEASGIKQKQKERKRDMVIYKLNYLTTLLLSPEFDGAHV